MSIGNDAMTSNALWIAQSKARGGAAIHYRMTPVRRDASSLRHHSFSFRPRLSSRSQKTRRIAPPGWPVLWYIRNRPSSPQHQARPFR